MRKKIIYGCEARGDAQSPYLTRYTLISTRWFQLCVHVFHRSDSPELHDHPWDFITLPLWRGYWNVAVEGRTYARPLVPYYRKAEHSHRVELLRKRFRELSHQEYMPGKFAMGWGPERELPAVSLVLMFKRRREWGFFTSKGWQLWTSYFRERGC